ncbi:spirocyclase AveC family protein [Amycolatopsis methanolica]|uniref:DUF5135 domain-containing protein n=1 Tax=Amycolatopsis methanolica 239 TaxID=1068978 RepID=A0A076MR15_AMYME|nr:spirocyclase AveC family protein [Amycolatopsis methanolica]AIJ21310.1 hypothetical protein AMETH_1218 [Amycolatopsis methanolica 239]
MGFSTKTSPRQYDRAPQLELAESLAPRKTQPVKLFAIVGAIFLALTMYCWADWLFSGDAKAAPLGPTPIPGWLRNSALIWQIGFGAGGLAVLYFFLIRPWVREGRLTFDGMMVLCWLQLWALQDPLANYTVQIFNYNAVLFNRGCPQCHLPGWQSPHGERMAEPLVLGPGLYLVGLFLIVLLCNHIMSLAKRRWPRLGTVGLIVVAIVFMGVVDFVLEIIWIRTGLYHMGGSMRSMSLFAGEWYQVPLYEMFLWGTTWGLLACVRYFRNDRGETIAERGAAEIAGGQRKKAAVRLLALCGVMNLIMFVLFTLPWQWFGLHTDDYPQGILDRSYMTNGMCGQGSEYACPGPDIPVVRGPGSPYATPDGRLVQPGALPIQVGG